MRTSDAGPLWWDEPGELLDEPDRRPPELFDELCEPDELLAAQERRPTGQPTGHGELDEWLDTWGRRSNDLLEGPVGLGELTVRFGGNDTV